ncbi:hypothetical protein, unknown function [Leishmania mexicana MHOM/GT/2001/U1103]|uniref:Uncharacterized protein n=1 Tax=Leishmania mexicana (strain MHOM/GT/2001/U1103) TaxID=929439 RepID=E9AYP9_LEIMU|nr:hypothetical protein, unknown function [Leishmania mexicana MHOM/GT/2001/U1103]CBZ28092.1 hypothetical protein, unknown function [Leishmania mexicana MHOM/GT/2001/U1103]
MLPQCFYLAALITTAMTITTSNVAFYQEGLSTRITDTPVVVHNIAPDWIETAAMTVSSTTKELAVVFADPLRAHITADVIIGDSATAVAADVNVSIYGAFNISKIPHDDDCRTQSFVMHSCHMYMRVSGTVDTVAKVPDDEQNICDAVNQITNDLITPTAFITYPPVVNGATDIAKSTYIMKYRLVNVLSENTGLPVEAHFVRKNVLRVAFGSVVRTSILFDSAYDYDVDVLYAMAVLSRWGAKKLNISAAPENSTTTKIPFRGGAVTVPTLRSIVRQAIHEDALATLRTLVPRGAAVSYDVVINDFQCKLFNTICSVPVSNGVQVINTRFRGMGDLGTILDNTVSASMDVLLTNITTVAFKLVGSTFGDRIYLPVF